MDKRYTVKLSTVVEEHALEILNKASDFEEALIDTPDLNRPGLQLAGFYDYFDTRRVQVMGKVEATYLAGLMPELRRKRLDKYVSTRPSSIILCHGVAEPEGLLELCRKYDVNLFRAEEDTSEFMAQMIGTLRAYLAPRITRHGVLVEVHGEGMLITGESGVGKSETALELIKRGHRLIADDAVEIRRMSRTSLVGSAPEIIRYYMELRGIGVVNVRHIFGVGAVKPSCQIDMVVNFELWEDDKFYDRLGLDTNYTELLGVKVPITTIPVRPGRNLAVILELAAMNNRQKKMGFNAALDLAQAVDSVAGYDITGGRM